MADLTGIGKYIRTLGGPMTSAISGLGDFKVIQDVFFEVDEKATSIAKKFGQGRENILGIKQSMTDAYQEVAKMGGKFSDIYDIQSDFTDTLGRNVLLNTESYEQFYAMTEVTGQNMRQITEGFKNAGYSIYQAGDQMQKVVDTAREIGVSVQGVSQKVVENMDYLNKFNFQGGVEGLAKMAAQATNLRISMKETLNFADKVFNPEGAIETAAALQRLGVTQAQLLDPLRLMNLAQNDPTELQNQIVEMTKSFVKMGDAGNFEIMPGGKRRFMEISKAMGISYNELTKMALGSAELDDKMKKIKFPDVDQMASKETRQLIANLAEKGKDGEYKVKFTDEKGDVVEKNITELSEKDVEILKQPPKSMEDIAKDQLSIVKSIKASMDVIKNSTGMAIAGAKTTEQFMDAEVKMYEKISDTFVKTFDVVQIRTSMDTGLQKMFDSILDGDTMKGFTEGAEDITSAFKKMTTVFSEEGAKKWNEFITDDNKIIRVLVTLGEQLKNLGSEGIDKLKEKIQTIVGGGTVTGNTGSQGQNPPNLQNTGSQGQNRPNLQDFVFSPGEMQKVEFPDIPQIGELQALPQDKIKIYGGTKLDENEQKMPELPNLPKLPELPELPQYSPQVVPSQLQNTSSNITVNVNVTVNGGNNSNISVKDIENAMQNSALIQTIKTELKNRQGPNNNTQPDQVRKEMSREKFRR